VSRGIPGVSGIGANRAGCGPGGACPPARCGRGGCRTGHCHDVGQAAVVTVVGCLAGGKSVHRCTSTRVHTRRDGRRGSLRRLPGGVNACRACRVAGVARFHAHAVHAYVRVRVCPGTGRPGGCVTAVVSPRRSQPRSPSGCGGAGPEQTAPGEWVRGLRFGGELGARRGRRVGVSRAGRIGADGSGAQRAAVGHRPVIGGAAGVLHRHGAAPWLRPVMGSAQGPSWARHGLQPRQAHDGPQTGRHDGPDNTRACVRR
jgi:hypothetical protein